MGFGGVGGGGDVELRPGPMALWSGGVGGCGDVEIRPGGITLFDTTVTAWSGGGGGGGVGLSDRLCCLGADDAESDGGAPEDLTGGGGGGAVGIARIGGDAIDCSA